MGTKICLWFSDKTIILWYLLHEARKWVFWENVIAVQEPVNGTDNARGQKKDISE